MIFVLKASILLLADIATNKLQILQLKSRKKYIYRPKCAALKHTLKSLDFGLEIFVFENLETIDICGYFKL